jgi:hypothetical protein
MKVKVIPDISNFQKQIRENPYHLSNPCIHFFKK